MTANGALYAITVLIWGSTWMAIDFQLGVVAPEVSVFYRYLAASALLFAWCLLRRLPLAYGLRDHVTFALLGVTLFSLNYVLMYAAQQYIASALCAILFSTMLWMNMLNSRLFFGTRFELRTAAGSLLGVAGVVTLFWPQLGDPLDGPLGDQQRLAGLILGVGGTLVASFGNMVSQGAQSRRLPVLQANAWGMLYGSAATLVFVLVRGSEFDFDPSPGYALSLVYLVVFGSIAAFGAYLTLLGRIGAHRAAYAVVLFPVVAVLLSVLFEDMPLTVPTLGGMVLVIGGNLVALGDWRKAGGPAAGRRHYDSAPASESAG